MIIDPKGMGRRGIALPVALVGLVAVSLLVTTALLTSSAEFAISSAQTAGSRALYAAESGMQEFVRQLSATPQTLTLGSQDRTIAVSSGSGTTTTNVSVRSDLLQVTTPSPADGSATYVFAVTAQPLSAAGVAQGRAIVAFIEQSLPRTVALSTNITSAITLGGNMHVNGNAFTINGRSNACGANGGVDAVQAASTSEISANNEGHWDNFLGYEDGENSSGRDAIDQTSMSKEELAASVLGGYTIEELIAITPDYRKWGPRFGRDPWNGYLHDSVGIAIVDANEGVVEIEGGTGVLIVVNGNIVMNGNSSFTGIIIVEGNFNLSGTPTVTGALISLATNTGLNTINLEPSAIGNGHITVQYDKCAIQAAEQAFSNQGQQRQARLSRVPFAWSEVVR